MSSKVNFIREGFHSITPSLSIRGAADAIEFYKKVFGATESYRMTDGHGKIMHAELRMGDSVLMLSEEMPEWGALSPKTVGGCPMSLMVYVPDVDATFAQALAAGAKEIRAPKDQFYGDRSGAVEDPFGYRWSISTQVEELSAEEMKKRETQWLKENAG
jgi:PhnB protein